MVTETMLIPPERLHQSLIAMHPYAVFTPEKVKWEQPGGAVLRLEGEEKKCAEWPLHFKLTGHP